MDRRARLALVVGVVTSVTLSATAMLTSVRAQEPAQRQFQLPDGPGKEVVQANCTRCHALGNIGSTWGYTKDGWKALIDTMVELPAPQTDAAAAYLAAHFPEKQVPPAKIVPGTVNLAMKEFTIPTLGSRPHDGLGTKDGLLWYSGSWSNKIGQIDPKTGAIKEWDMKTPVSGPQGMVEDKDGNVWFTAIQKNYVAKLNRKTGEITEYRSQDPAHTGFHTPWMDQKGNFWFTIRSGHIGRVNTATGEMKIVAVPSKETYPYGLTIDSKGVPWYVDFDGNRIGSLDPTTMAVTEHTLPNANSRPRRIAITPDDAIWYTDYPRGYIGRYDQKTGAVKEWPSPSGPASGPYGMTSVGNVVWYTESSVKPNTLVRFDPQTEKFQSWPITLAGLPIQGVVRHMAAAPNGNIVMIQSRVNRVVLAEVSGAARTSTGAQ
jgi:virginiamycin B lyase